MPNTFEKNSNNCCYDQFFQNIKKNLNVGCPKTEENSHFNHISNVPIKYWELKDAISNKIQPQVLMVSPTCS